jgi:GntR family transcriptional regulator, transcriptional repressor for pyruvate dehydrogenase complex
MAEKTKSKASRKRAGKSASAKGSAKPRNAASKAKKAAKPAKAAKAPKPAAASSPGGNGSAANGGGDEMSRDMIGLQGRRRVSSNKPKKTAILVAQRIVDEIVDQELQPGAALLPEKVMLPRYGVARGTLRESLRILETYGLITIKTGPGGGPVVADAGSRPLASVIALVLQMSRTSFRSIVDARLMLEPLLAREAAERRDDDDLTAMRESIDQMVDDIEDSNDFLADNHVFHSAVAAAGKNPVLFNMVASLNWIQDGTALGIDYVPATRDSIVKAHKRIYAAIEAGNPDMAEAAMRVHIGEFAAYAEKKFRHVLDQPLRWDQVDT